MSEASLKFIMEQANALLAGCESTLDADGERSAPHSDIHLATIASLVAHIEIAERERSLSRDALSCEEADSESLERKIASAGKSLEEAVKAHRATLILVEEAMRSVEVVMRQTLPAEIAMGALTLNELLLLARRDHKAGTRWVRILSDAPPSRDACEDPTDPDCRCLHVG